MKTAPSL